MLTGTGVDGALGVLAVKSRGGVVIAQNPASSEYLGMPEAAIKTGKVDYVLSLDDIAKTIDALVRGEPVRSD